MIVILEPRVCVSGGEVNVVDYDHSDHVLVDACTVRVGEPWCANH